MKTHGVLNDLLISTLVTQLELKKAVPERTGGLSVDLRKYTSSINRQRVRKENVQDVVNAFERIGLVTQPLYNDKLAIDFSDVTVDLCNGFIIVSTPRGNHGLKV